MDAELTKQYEKGIECVKDGRYQEALPLLSAVLEDSHAEFAKVEHARMLLGFSRTQLKDWNGAIDCFRTAMINDFNCMPAQTALGHAYIMAGRLTEAIETFTTAVQKDPKNAAAHHGLGWALALEGTRLEEALSETHEAVRLDPKSPAVRDSVGWTLYKLGDIEAASEQLEEAIRLDPDHPVILAHWREVREMLKKKSQEDRKAPQGRGAADAKRGDRA